MIGNVLLRRFLLNASRQAAGAALFFLFTLSLSRWLGGAGFAAYFAAWNLALVIAAVSDLGLFTEMIRRLATGQSARTATRTLWRAYLLQALIVVAASQLAPLWGSSALSVTCIAAAVVASNLLTAIALGKDWFGRFVVGELVMNASLLVAVVLLPPSSSEAMGWYHLGSCAAKLLCFVGWGASRRAAGPAAPAAAPLDPALPGGAARARQAKGYAHSLLDIGVYRGTYLVLAQILGPTAMATIAVAWSLCDRALLIVQGVNQVLVPKMMQAELPARVLLATRSITTLVFVAAVFGMAALWTLLQNAGYAAAANPIAWRDMALLAAAFLPLVGTQLLRAEALARERYAHLFASHAAAMVALLAAAAGLAWLGTRDPRASAALLVVVFTAALLPLLLRRFSPG